MLYSCRIVTDCPERTFEIEAPSEDEAVLLLLRAWRETLIWTPEAERHWCWPREIWVGSVRYERPWRKPFPEGARPVPVYEEDLSA